MKIFKTAAIVLLFATLAWPMQAQESRRTDTLQCHIVGFGVGLKGAWAEGSTSWGGHEGGNMADLYSNPSLDFSIDWDYKFRSNWLLTFDGDFWFGINSNNLRQREKRMGDIFTHQGYAMGWGGYDGSVSFYNRGFSAQLGVGKLFPVLPNNPNSGISLRLMAGWYLQQTKFVQEYTESPVYAFKDDYAKLYDHLRNGIILTQGVGFWYMHNSSTFVNAKIEFTISELVGWSSRPYIIDNVMQLKGKDKNTYLDLVFGVKLTWMFPLTGKTTYDYYYF